jgi:hypothetical protein
MWLTLAPLVHQSGLAHSTAAVEYGELRAGASIAAFKVGQLALAVEKHRYTSQLYLTRMLF